MPTAAEIALVAGNEFAADIITAVYRELKVFAAFQALPLRGRKFSTLAWKADAAAGGFLRRGQGYTATEGSLVKGEVNAARVGFMVKSPCSTTDEFDRETAANGISTPGFLQINARSRGYSEFVNIEKQIFLGTANDSLGFPGLKEICAYTSSNLLTTSQDAASYDFARSVINVGGSTSNTASSVYGVNMGPNAVHLRVGGDNGIAGFLALSPVKKEFDADSEDSTRQQEYYKAACEGYIGMSVSGSDSVFADQNYSQFDVRRLANVTAQAGYTLTQTLMDLLWDSFPDGHKPTHFFMSRRSRRQLRDDIDAALTVNVQMSSGDAALRTSRTKTQLPDEWNGIPIIETVRITDTQAIES